MELLEIGNKLRLLDDIKFKNKVFENFEYLYLESGYYAVRNNLTNELKIVSAKNPKKAVDKAFPIFEPVIDGNKVFGSIVKEREIEQ